MCWNRSLAISLFEKEWCESNVKDHVSAFEYVLIDSFWKEKKKSVKLFIFSKVQTCCTHCFKIVVIAKKCINYNINLEWCYYFIKVSTLFVKQYFIYIWSGISSEFQTYF